MSRNDYQNAFLQYLADMQETRVDITMCEHKLWEHKDSEKIRALLLDATYGMIVDIMEMIDGYSSFTCDKLDIVNKRTGVGLKENPPIELHDHICDFIKHE